MAKRHAEAMKKSQELEHRNPQIAIDALLPANATIGGKPTLPLTLAHYVILEKINSPLVSGKPLDWKDVDNLDLMKMCYVVTHKASDCRDILAEGSEAFESAVFEFCENIPLQRNHHGVPPFGQCQDGRPDSGVGRGQDCTVRLS